MVRILIALPANRHISMEAGAIEMFIAGRLEKEEEGEEGATTAASYLRVLVNFGQIKKEHKTRVLRPLTHSHSHTYTWRARIFAW